MTVVYLSCNAVTLAKDLECMPSYAPVQGRLLICSRIRLQVMVLLQKQKRLMRRRWRPDDSPRHHRLFVPAVSEV